MKPFPYLIIFLLVMDISLAATISGTVYDLSLNKVDNVMVEINTEPKQRDITEEGYYLFQVTLGKYTITALHTANSQILASTSEEITISKEGDFRLDLILFPEFSEEDELVEEDINIENNILEEEKGTRSYALLIIAVIVILCILLFLIFKIHLFRKIKKEEIDDNETKKVIQFIESQGKRTTQKDIRKHFPSSEAKISLVLTQLESEGKIKKIKKGRGNIIILK